MAAPINLALYRLLIKTGASEADAEEAARVDKTDLVTKADLELAIAQLKADLQRVILQAMLGVTGIFAAIVTIIAGLFRFFGA